MAVSWEEKFNELQQTLDDYKATTEAKLSEYAQLTKSNEPSANTNHDYTFWKEMDIKILTEPETVKWMIKNKELSVTETDDGGCTILCVAASLGAY